MIKIGTRSAPTPPVCCCWALENSSRQSPSRHSVSGREVLAADRCAHAPAMQVAHRSHVINMLDGTEVRRVVELGKPHDIVPEHEMVATGTTAIGPHP